MYSHHRVRFTTFLDMSNLLTGGDGIPVHSMINQHT